MSDLDRIHIVGTGLIGTSIGLAVRAAGLDVTLEDPSPTTLALAADLGAGRRRDADESDPPLVVVACPPDVAAQVVAAQLHRYPSATVTDVASVKRVIEGELRAATADLERYVGSHPMAGRERSGAIAARSDLFIGRPWVVVTHDRSQASRVAQVEQLAGQVGAVVARMPAREHDSAVAAVSHLPQIAASLVASRLRDLPSDSVALAGQGLRDVTRIAASDPALWTQILVGNAGAVRDVLTGVAADLRDLVGALEEIGDDPDSPAPGARRVLATAIADGNAGYACIPGKHGASPLAYAVVTVLVPDTPGALARLLHEIGEEGVNLEDLHLEHELGREVGIAEVSVLPAASEQLRDSLRRRGWTVLE